MAAHPEVEARLIAVAGKERTYQWDTEESGAAWLVLEIGTPSPVVNDQVVGNGLPPTSFRAVVVWAT